MTVARHVIEKVERMVSRGMSLNRAARFAGVARSTAYRRTSCKPETRIVRPRMSEERVAVVDRMLREERYTIAEIARAAACSKATVIERRKVVLPHVKLDPLHKRCRSTFKCPDCGRLVNIRPCLACTTEQRGRK